MVQISELLAFSLLNRQPGLVLAQALSNGLGILIELLHYLLVGLDHHEGVVGLRCCLGDGAEVLLERLDSAVDAGEVVVEVPAQLEDVLLDVELAAAHVPPLLLDGLAVPQHPFVGLLELLDADQHLLLSSVVVQLHVPQPLPDLLLV